MIHFLDGVIASKQPDGIVMDVGGVGFFVGASPATLAGLPDAGEKARLFTYLSVKEDAMDLYGFLTQEQQRMFVRLISISGVGPKSALALLGQMSVSDFSLAVLSEDAKAIARTPGLGLKTAQKIILELKDKVGESEIFAPKTGRAPVALPGADQIVQDAIDALVTLGYQTSDAAKAVSRVRDEAQTLDDLIRMALREASQ